MTYYSSKRRSSGQSALHLAIVAVALFAAGYALAAETTLPNSAADRAQTAQAPAPSSSLTVRVTLPDAAPGAVRLGLFNTAQDYAEQREAVAHTARVERGRAEFALTDLEPGQYAFRLYHDANANGRLDTGAFGLPTEPYFYSNDASDLFSAPEWSEASFRLSDGDYAYEVELD